MSPVVRRMGRPDFDAVLEITASSASAGEKHDAKLTREKLEAELSRAWSHVWVADDGAAARGFLIAWHVADELEILDVVTHTGARRRGLGRALLNAAIDYARENKLAHVLLEVRPSNAPAIGLYRASGFRVSGTRARYYPDDEDALVMRLALDPTSGQVIAAADEDE